MSKRKIIVISILAVLLVLIVVGAILVWNFFSQFPPEISVSKRPDKTSYYIGEQLELDGLEVVYRKNEFANPKQLNLDQLTISGFDSSVPCKSQVITVTYGQLTTQFVVEIKDFPTVEKTVEKVELRAKDGLEIKTVYYQFEELELDSMELLVTYTDGSTDVLDVTHPDVVISGANLWLVENDHEVTFTYQRRYTTLIVDVVAQPATE